MYYITTRAYCDGSPTEKHTASWLSAKFGLSYPTVIVSKNKGAVAAALELDAFIDDNYDNLVSVAMQRPNADLYYRLSPYSVVGDFDFVDVTGFSEFVDLVLK